MAASPDTNPPPPLSLRRNIAWAATGNAFLNICRFVIIVLIAKFADAATVGAFSAAMKWSAPIVTFLMLQLRGAYVADTRGEFTFGTYTTLRAWAMFAAGVVLLLLIFWRFATGTPAPDLLILAGVGAGKITWALGEVHWGVFQKGERLDLMARSFFLRGLIMLVPFAVLLPLAPAAGLTGPTAVATGAALYAAGWLLVNLLFDWRRSRTISRLDYSWTPVGVRRLAFQTLPLGVVILLIALGDSLPVMVIDGLGERARDELGYFGAMADVMLPINLLVVAICQAAANRLADSFTRAPHRFLRLWLRLLVIVVVLGIGSVIAAAFAGEWALRICFRPEYARYSHELVLIVLGGALLLPASLFGITVTATRHFWVQVPAQVTILAATAIAAWYWIPSDPVRGGALTAVVRSSAQAILYGLVLFGIVWRRWRSPDPPTTPSA